MIISSEYSTSVTKFLYIYGVLWILLVGFMLLTSLKFHRYPLSVFQILAWIIAGLVVGVISGKIYTKNLLNRLSKEYQIFINEKEIALLIVPAVLFSILGFFIGLFRTSVGEWAFQELYIWIYSWGISMHITRTILFAAFEKKENMRVMQSCWGSGLVLIPKPPNINNNLKQQRLNGA